MGSIGGGSSEKGEEQATVGDPPPPAVCVTGSTGYVGSWLVRTLLLRGYRVHATARDTGKAWQVLGSAEEEGRERRLRVFRADLGEDGSFDAAVRGCVALFHVAASMEIHVPPGQDNVEEHVRSRVLEPATRGTVNVLQSCVRAGTVRRVVFTSSISTMTAAGAEGRQRKAVVDESCVTALDDVWRAKPVGWIYILSKRLTEEAAFEFAREKGVHLVSIVIPTVAGPFLTPTVPTSVQLLLSPITGDPKLYSLLASVHARFGCLPLSHIQDVCDAHVFLMETPRAEGRYLCVGGSHSMPHIARLLASHYPPFRPAERLSKDFDASSSSVVSSKRLLDLGFMFEYGIGDIVKESVAQCVQHGFLECPDDGRHDLE